MNFLAFLYSGYNIIVERKTPTLTDRSRAKNQKFLGVFNRCYNNIVDRDKQSQRQKVQANTSALYLVGIIPTSTRYSLDLHLAIHANGLACACTLTNRRCKRLITALRMQL